MPGTGYLAPSGTDASSLRWRKGVTQRQRPAQAPRAPAPALLPCGARYGGGGGAAGAGSGLAAAVRVCQAAGEAARARLRGRVGGGNVCRGPPPPRHRPCFPRRGWRRRLGGRSGAGSRKTLLPPARKCRRGEREGALAEVVVRPPLQRVLPVMTTGGKLPSFPYAWSAQ